MRGRGPDRGVGVGISVTDPMALWVVITWGPPWGAVNISLQQECIPVGCILHPYAGHVANPTACGQTNTYENITFPQTSFAGDNKTWCMTEAYRSAFSSLFFSFQAS